MSTAGVPSSHCPWSSVAAAASSSAIASVDVRAATSLLTEKDPLLDLVIVAVEFTDDSPAQLYQLLVGRRDQPRSDLQYAEIGRLGDHVAYDALWDTEVTDWLLQAVRGLATAEPERHVDWETDVVPYQR